MSLRKSPQRAEFRVQMIRQMGVLAGDEPVSANTWEEIKRTDKGVEEWIDKNLDRKTCLCRINRQRNRRAKVD